MPETTVEGLCRVIKGLRDDLVQQEEEIGRLKARLAQRDAEVDRLKQGIRRLSREQKCKE